MPWVLVDDDPNLSSEIRAREEKLDRAYYRSIPKKTNSLYIPKQEKEYYTTLPQKHYQAANQSYYAPNTVKVVEHEHPVIHMHHVIHKHIYTNEYDPNDKQHLTTTIPRRSSNHYYPPPAQYNLPPSYYDRSYQTSSYDHRPPFRY